MKRNFIIFCSILFLLVNNGCDQFNKTKLRERVLAQDTNFSETLKKRDDIDSKVLQSKKDFTDFKSQIDSQVRELRKNLLEKRKETDANIKVLISQLDNERMQLAMELRDLQRDLKEKETRLKNLKSMTNDTKKWIEKGNRMDLSPEEKARWEERLKSLETQSEPIKKEIADLKEGIRGRRGKLTLLKQ